MSYCRTFKPTEEQIEELKKHTSRYSVFNNLDTSILELSVYCMQDHSSEKNKEVINAIQMLLMSVKYDCILKAYDNALEKYEEDKNKEIWYEGRTYDEEFCDDNFYYVLSELVHLACVVKTPDWFDESEKYSEKKNEINELINEFEDCQTTLGDFEIIEKLKDCETTMTDDELREQLNYTN